MKKVTIKSEAKRRIETFFPWVYKNEILSSLESYEKGEVVEIIDSDGNFLALGYINPQSVIAIRILSYRPQPIDKAFFSKSIEKAVQKRIDIPSNAMRLVHAEADFLPGLIIDRYDEYLVVHILTAGMMRFKEEIIDTLLDILAPKGIVVASQEYAMKREGFSLEKSVIGVVPSSVKIEENGLFFTSDILHAQKTGFYLDQRKNREIVASHLKQKSKVLDCFCNTGGFGLYARVKKGAFVRLVDISQEAIEVARNNFALNGVDGEFVVANVFDYLRVLRKAKEKFDCIILDPPSFAKTKGQKSGALKGFKDITVNAMKLLEDDGMIALFSCSQAIEMNDLKNIVIKAAKDNGQVIEVMEHLYQDSDHPYILNHPQSLYLKGLLFKVVQ